MGRGGAIASETGTLKKFDSDFEKALTKAKLLKPTYDVGSQNRHRKSVLAILNREPELLEQFLKFIPTIKFRKLM